jgi:type I restriction enzyme R subunit
VGKLKEERLFNENTRVKFPATIHLLRLGYKYQSYNDAMLNGYVETNTKIFINIFKTAIERINHIKLSSSETFDLINEILQVIKNNDLGKEFYNWLINPVDKIKLIDFNDINNNDFHVVNELTFGEKLEGSFRPDINVLVNGIPLAFLEVKIPNNLGGIQVEYDRIVNKRYEQEEHRKYFNMIQLTCFSNNMEYETDDDTAVEPKAGSFYSTPNGFRTSFNYFRDEKKRVVGFGDDNDDLISFILKDNSYPESILYDENFITNLAFNSPTNSFCSSIFEKERLMYMLQYGMLFIDAEVKEKHIMRYPQFFASQAIINRLDKGQKRGIIWHTQGSGKTALSVYANRVISDYYAKKGIHTRFFFVVDRLDLLTQAKTEFTLRNCEAIGVNSREDFIKELNKTISVGRSMTSMGSSTVVNIQKFSDNLPEPKNDYDAKVQRVFFIDEAHRSYAKPTGEFYQNLMLMDRDAIFIALTGTPLLSKKERSNLQFGDYIHKYFYDKSILDGYTLKIKKEEIETLAKAEIKRNLEFELKGQGVAKVLESDDYITALGRYIDNDFQNFRLVNEDPTIGAMIVCNTNDQAKKMQAWFEINSKLVTRLIISDEAIPSAVNEENQKAFKESKNGIDLLIVHLMLTTGYDVKRLKKMYLLRAPKEHSLLQTISRVNRPYKSITGKFYQYGYVTDFVDITEEYDRTISNYLRELEQDLVDSEEGGIPPSSVIVGADDIQKRYDAAVSELSTLCDTSHLEEFSIFLSSISDKQKLYIIRKLLTRILECRAEFLLSHNDDSAKQIDKNHIKKLIKLVENRINFINISSTPIDAIRILNNNDVVEIVFEFLKIRTIILNMSIGEEIKDKITRLIKAIKVIKNTSDIKVVKLNEFLQSVFEKLAINDIDDLTNLDEEIQKAITEAERINLENKMLADVFGGNFAYVKTYQDVIKEYQTVDRVKVQKLLLIIRESVENISGVNNLVLIGKTNFVDNVKKKATPSLITTRLYKDLNLKEWYDSLLSQVFINLQIYK